MKSLIFSLAFVFSLIARGQEVPSFETVVEEVIFNTSTRTVIDEKTIKDSRAPNITSLLSTQANLTVTNTPVQPNSIFIRGGDGGHVLIVLDGVPFYDASTSQRTFNLNSLDIKSVRRIEIIKGSQTVLYGGQALSGVIKIETIPQELSSRSVLKGHAGTHEEKDLSFFHIEELSQDWGIIFRGQGMWREAESPVLQSTKTYSKNSWNGESTLVFKGPIEGYLKGQYIQERSLTPKTNNSTLRIQDTDEFEQFRRHLAATSFFKFNEVAWNPRLSIGLQNSLKLFDQPINSTNTTLTDRDYGGNLKTLRVDMTPVKKDNFVLQSGLSYINEEFIYRDKGVESVNKLTEQRGMYLKGDLKASEYVDLLAGVRAESWKDKDVVSTYQAGVVFNETTKFEVSTGYKIPSLFQLYSGDYGNPNLKEEKSTQYNFTQDLKLNEDLQLSLTLFKSQFSNLILISGSFPALQYKNVSEAESQGVEVVANWRISPASSLLLTYGYQEPRDLDKNTWLNKRPLVNGSVRYTQSWNEFRGSLEVMGAGERVDQVSLTRTGSLPGYVVFNASGSYDYDQSLSLYARFNNLNDHRYQESFSYYAEGFSAFVGAEYSF